MGTPKHKARDNCKHNRRRCLRGCGQRKRHEPGTTESAALATFAAAFSKTGVDTTIILIGGHDRTFEYQNQVKPTFRPVLSVNVIS